MFGYKLETIEKIQSLAWKKYQKFTSNVSKAKFKLEKKRIEEIVTREPKIYNLTTVPVPEDLNSEKVSAIYS